MENQTSNLQKAVVYGLLLSLVTILHSLLTATMEISGIVGILLWIVKFGAVIYLFYYFMKKRSLEFEVYTYGDSFRFGFLVCVFSTIACAAYSILQFTVIFPDMVSGQLEQVMAIMEQSGSDTSALESINMGKIMRGVIFFGMPIYYMIWGLILSAIFASSTKRNNITYEG